MQPEIAKLLWDMLAAARRIESFTLNKKFDDYRTDELLKSGVERQFEIIGEAMTRLMKSDPTIAATISDHRKIAGFRNALIHGYDVIDDTISWSIVEQKLPILRSQLEAMLSSPAQTPPIIP
jgi:uncharacterized protein with HEPN domain